jgi:hypothetical protein
VRSFFYGLLSLDTCSLINCTGWKSFFTANLDFSVMEPICVVGLQGKGKVDGSHLSANFPVFLMNQIATVACLRGFGLGLKVIPLT